MKAIMYHYVRIPDIRIPYFKFLHFKNFKKQLDYLQSNYQILDPLVISKSVAADGIILTFDDGLKDHFDYVMPELIKRNLKAIFYISTGVYQKNKLLDVHRLHMLLGKYGGTFIYKRLKSLITDEMLVDAHVEEFKKLTYLTQENDDFTTIVKRIVNYFMNYMYLEDVMDQLMSDLFDDEEKLSASFYLSKNEIRDMHNQGMLIGSHTVNHKVMSKLSSEEQEFEIEKSFSFLETITKGLKCKTFCYPYGGFHTFTNETEKILEKHHSSFAFNVEPRDIETVDLAERRQALPRYDCNLFPHGKIFKYE